MDRNRSRALRAQSALEERLASPRDGDRRGHEREGGQGFPVDRRRPLSFSCLRSATAPRRRKIEIDISRWPLVCHSFNGKQTDMDVSHYIRCINRIYDRREPFVTLVRLSNFRGDVRHIKRIASWMQEHHSGTAKYSLGHALVMQTKAVKLLSTVSRPLHFDNPHFVTEDYDEACDWLIARMRREGLPVPKFPAEDE